MSAILFYAGLAVALWALVGVIVAEISYRRGLIDGAFWTIAAICWPLAVYDMSRRDP